MRFTADNHFSTVLPNTGKAEHQLKFTVAGNQNGNPVAVIKGESEVWIRQSELAQYFMNDIAFDDIDSVTYTAGMVSPFGEKTDFTSSDKVDGYEVVVYYNSPKTPHSYINTADQKPYTT